MFALLTLLVASADVAPPPAEAVAAEETAPDAAGPAPAVATPDGLRILVVAPGADEVRVEEIYSGLRAAGLSPVELDERAGIDREGTPPAPLGNREEARARLQEAKARFRDLDLEGTRSALDAAVDEVLRLERPEESIETLADALLLRASAALQSGVDEEARTALVLLARLEPARIELHPGLHPPSLVDAYAAARIDEEARAPGDLVVRPRVAGFANAELLVDGRAVNASSALALRQGPHLVTVRAPGTTPFSRILEVGADPLVLEPFLAPADAPERRAALIARARGATVDDARAEALDEVAALSAARAVLYVDAKDAQLFGVGRPLEGLRVPPTSSGAVLGRAALATLQAPARRDQGLPVDDELDPAFLVGSSAAGIVVVTGVVIGALAALLPAVVPAPPPRPVPVVCCVQF